MSNKSGLSTAWKPGQSGNPKGRVPDSRNKLSEEFVLTLYEHFLQYGAKAIERVYNSRPDVYVKVVASLIPKEFHFKNESAFEGLSREQLDQTITEIKSILTASTPSGLGAGSTTPGRSEKPDSIH